MSRTLAVCVGYVLHTAYTHYTLSHYSEKEYILVLWIIIALAALSGDIAQAIRDKK
jgi:hypothetical protein